MKIRTGFVSNSSSSAFIMPSTALSMDELHKLAMAFGRVEITENEEVMVVYNCGQPLAQKILVGLFGGNKPINIRWTNVS